MTIARDVKGNKKGAYLAHQQQQARENLDSLKNESGDMILKDMEKDNIANAFFTLIFPGNTRLQQSQVSETGAKVQCKVHLTLVEKDQVRDYLNKLDTH